MLLTYDQIITSVRQLASSLRTAQHYMAKSSNITIEAHGQPRHAYTAVHVKPSNACFSKV
jgi:hypothetical protein